MADEKIVFKVVVDDEGNIVKLQSTEKGFRDIDLTVKNAENSAKKLNQTIAKTGSGGTLKSLKLTQKEYGKLVKTQHQISDATGSATSATMELGRVISDAPYGIRGMANNITQLVSQLGTASVKAGGLTNALKLMWTQLMGPLGIVLAITAAVSALDFFAGAQTKAKGETKDHNDELERQYNKLSELNSLQKTISASGDAISLDWIDSFISGLDKIETKDLLRILERDIKGITEAFKKLPEESRNIKGISALVEKRKEFIKNIGEEKRIKEELLELEKEFAPYRFFESEKGDEIRDKIIEKQKDLLVVQKSILDVEEQFSKIKDKPKGVQDKLLEIDDFDKQAEDYLDKIASVSQKEEILNAELNSDKVLIQERYHLERLEATHLQNQSKFKQQADAYRIEYEAFLDQQVRMTDLTKEEAKVKLDDFDKSTKSEKKKSEDNYKILIEKWKSYYFDKVFIALQAEQKIKDSKKTETETEFKELDKLQTYVQEYKKLMSGVTEFLDGEFERQLTIEQNKTNVLNKELNDRLINENLSAEQRKSIQLEIAQNDENLRVKQDAINKKKFKQTKALNLSMALIDTYAGATQVLADKKLPSWAKIPMMVSIIGAGLAQVAAISRQKFQSSSANTPIRTTADSGGGGTTERADPSFNIVGRSNENLLINAIQAQFDKPLKAYVVSRDVTNQQQLDGMIVSQAGT